MTTQQERTAARTLRPIGVAAAAGAALAVWLIARYGAGLQPRTPSFAPTGQPMALAAGFAVVVAAVVALAGWGLVALLDRRAARPRRAWLVIGLVVLAVSLSGPLSGYGLTGGERLVLLCLHLSVGAVLIPWYARGLARDGAQLARRARSSADS